MYFLIQCLIIFSLSASIQAEEIFIPEPFREGQLVEQVILISDVDGVVRESIDGIADPRVIEAIKLLLENKNVDVTFISGTPIENDQALEPWRRGNVSLSKVFGPSFEKELSEGDVTIYVVLGGHKMNGDGSLEVFDEYSREVSCEIGRFLIRAFLQEVLLEGTLDQKVWQKIFK